MKKQKLRYSELYFFNSLSHILFMLRSDFEDIALKLLTEAWGDKL